MLVELSMVEHRYDAVREVLDEATATDVATRYGSTDGSTPLVGPLRQRGSRGTRRSQLQT